MKRNILRDIVRLGWPVFVAQIAVMANGLIDTVMAGRYGTLDLAAVGIGASIYVTLFVTLMGEPSCCSSIRSASRNPTMPCFDAA